MAYGVLLEFGKALNLHSHILSLSSHLISSHLKLQELSAELTI